MDTLSLSGVELNACEISRDEPGDPRKPLEFESRCVIGAFVPPNRTDIVALWAILELSICQTRKPTKKNPDPVQVLATISASHVAELPLEDGSSLNIESEQALTDFAGSRGAELLYPHIAEFVADTVRRLGFPPLYLTATDANFEAHSISELTDADED